MAAEHATPEAINFMAKHGRGLICVPTTADRLQQLGVERMVTQNRETFKTDFQVSVDAARGITTGISAADRARTIQVMADPTAVPEDLVQPGHVFPLRAKAGGVLQRAGHTEAAVDLAVEPGAIRLTRGNTVLRRVVPLAPQARAVARTLAVLRTVGLDRLGLLAEVTSLPEPAVAAAFDDLVRAHVVTDTDGRYRFSHALVRQLSCADGGGLHAGTSSSRCRARAST